MKQIRPSVAFKSRRVTFTVYQLLCYKDRVRRDMRCEVTDVHMSLIKAEILLTLGVTTREEH